MWQLEQAESTISLYKATLSLERDSSESQNTIPNYVDSFQAESGLFQNPSLPY